MLFYNELAEQYDEIVGESHRVEEVQEFAARLVEKHGVRSVLDVACGTGLYARVLAGLGLRVSAADISSEMLALARNKTGRQSGGEIEWILSPMETLDQAATGPFDAILCMGNSLPHLLTDEQLRAALRNFRRLVAPKGVVIVQLLNYSRLLRRQERIVGVTRADRVEYIRFYDFLGDRVRFNILRLEWTEDRCFHHLHHTLLRPYLAGQLLAAFSEAGFAAPVFYGDLKGTPFDAVESEQLVVQAGG